MENNLIPFDPDWDKVLEKLEADQAAGLELNAEEENLLKELQRIRTESGEALKAYHTFDTDNKWAEFKQQIAAEDTAKEKNHQPISLWLRISATAAAIFIIAGIGLVFQKTKQQHQQSVNVFLNDIPAGKQSATLTLDNGQKIVLSGAGNGQVSAESGIVISKSADGQLQYRVSAQDVHASSKIHTLSTGNGETYRLQLPDHTEIWLNSASSIKFPASFEGLKDRKVELKGEAYFEIAKNKKHPFIVKTEQQEIQVLGTHFNVNSDPDQGNTRTTLLEGSLRITNNAKKEQLIKPGEQSLVNGGADILVSPADLKSTMAWKNGYFRFNGARIDEVMLKISRWYDLEVTYQGPISKERFSGNISRNKNISEVLNMLSYSKAVKFKVEGRRLTVMQ
ncbi:FecR family protein [Pedobacter gandavensis]|uniref:FecR family protein n=1 Tax=Pedobacter gandavensis TaxID=2679963 RepID=UPI002479EF2F|nr:FecR family protein [Pedobacter gandavensis]WGQ10487.1 FecR family protein [Pedobacter gandavensis]